MVQPVTHKLPRGILVAIEGIDGAGKTTQARLMAEALKGVGLGVLSTKEPTAGKWGQKLRDSAQTGRLSAEDELHAFMEDRREHVALEIQPALDAGQVVIVDRYYFSNAAYQGARGMDPAKIIRLNEAFAPRPDLLVHIDVETSVGVHRIRKRGDVENLFEREEDLKKSAAIFAALEGPHVFRVSGMQSIEDVTRQVLRRLYEGPLYEVACRRSHEKNGCDVAFCSWRIAGVCIFPELGALAPDAVLPMDRKLATA